MMPSDDELIATRVFERDDGEVRLCVYKPFARAHPDFDNPPEDPPWNCQYSLHFPDGEVREGGAVGCDGIEVILLALARAQLELRIVMDGSDEARPTPRWLGSEDLGLDIIHF